MSNEFIVASDFIGKFLRDNFHLPLNNRFFESNNCIFDQAHDLSFVSFGSFNAICNSTSIVKACCGGHLGTGCLVDTKAADDRPVPSTNVSQFTIGKTDGSPKPDLG